MFGRYRVESALGKGAYGTVYLAEHINLKVFRAIKCIRKCQDIYGTAHREADVLKNLRHPAIPIIYDIEENDDCVCIIEEYVEGVSLNSFISTHKRISMRRIIQIVLQICEVVGYLHDNRIYHADIKPENILLDENFTVKISDFGLSRMVNILNISETKGKFGTTHWMPPEIMKAKKLSIGILNFFRVIFFSFLNKTPPL